MRHPQLLLAAPCQVGDLQGATSSLRTVTSQPTACGGNRKPEGRYSSIGKSPECLLWALGLRCDQNTYRFLLSQADNNIREGTGRMGGGDKFRGGR